MKCNRKKKYEADALACERLQETVEPLVEWFRGESERSSVAEACECVSGLDFRDYAAADESGSS